MWRQKEIQVYVQTPEYMDGFFVWRIDVKKGLNSSADSKSEEILKTTTKIGHTRRWRDVSDEDDDEFC